MYYKFILSDVNASLAVTLVYHILQSAVVDKSMSMGYF
jgi:hypothetical protein